jgi:Raf kinase inhibitor-like YbhB/YbcL family protein
MAETVLGESLSPGNAKGRQIRVIPGCKAIIGVYYKGHKEERIMRISSNAFEDGGFIPDEFTKEGGNHKPPLHFEDVPAEAKSLALIVDDPEGPNGTLTHWLAYNIPPTTRELGNGTPVAMQQAWNDFGQADYGGPKAPSGEHHYFFKLYALDDQISLQRGASRLDLEEAMLGHVIGRAEYMGRFAVHEMAGAR